MVVKEIGSMEIQFKKGDRVVLGATCLDNSRPNAIGGTVVGIRWSYKAQCYIYHVKDDNGKEQYESATNIILEK